MNGLIALLVGGLVSAAAFLVMTARRRFATQQLDWYAGPAQRTSEHSSLGWAALVASLERGLARLGMSERLRRALGRAGVDRTPGAFVAFVLLVSVALFALATIAVGMGAGILVAIGAPLAALVVLAIRAQRRARAFELQLPEILDSLSASLKAGHGFDHALQTMASEVGDPAGTEFRRVVVETHLGQPLDVALRDLGERVHSQDLEFVLDAIAIQRQVGGSLAELFELVSETVREREQFRRKLRAITGMVRASSTVLTALPVVAMLGLTLVNHSYEAPLFTTTTGRIMLMVTIGMVLVGGVILRRIGSVKP
jgi:tight adherence protein B